MKSKFVKFLLWCGVFALLGVIILWIEHGHCAAQLAAYQRTLGELLPPDPPASSNAAVVLKRLALHFSHYPEEVPWMEPVSSNAARVALQHNPLVQLEHDLTWESFAQVANANTNQLTELAPAFLARVLDDPMDGKPLRYRPLGHGNFLLYSIGWDGLDQGGDATEAPPSVVGRSSLQMFISGDESRWHKGRNWIWPLPATAEETELHAATLFKTRTPGPGIPRPPPLPPPPPP